MNHQII